MPFKEDFIHFPIHSEFSWWSKWLVTQTNIEHMIRYTAFDYGDPKMSQLKAEAAELVSLTSVRIRLIQREMN